MIRVSKKLFKLFTKRQKRNLFILLAMMLIGGIMESVSVSLILPLCTSLMRGDAWNKEWYAKWLCQIFDITKQRSYIELLLVLLIIIFILKNAYLLLEYYCQYTFIAKSRFKMQNELMEAYMSKTYEFYLSASSGEIIRIVNDDTRASFNLLSAVIQFYTEIIVSIIVGVAVMVISPYIAIRMIVILLIELLIIVKWLKPVLRRLGDRQREAGTKANKWLLQSINGVKSIKVAGTATFFRTNYLINAKELVETERKNQTLANLPRLTIEVITISGVLGIIFVMVLEGKDFSTLLPQLSAFIVATVRLLPSVNRMSSAINSISFSEGGLDNILKIVNGNIFDPVGSYATKNSGDNRIDFKNSLEFRNITYKYPANEKLIFNDASFEIKPGQSIGIIGVSGAGKTTAVDIILGLLKADKGGVYADGKLIDENIEDWHSHVSYIPQNIFLLDDSIRANVAFGKYECDINDVDVWEALNEAQLSKFVKELPDGLNTRVGEQGIRLSGGQRQRIGIARALYSNPQILFFDEATSALDNETEAAIMEAIGNLKGKKTLVIIAHRLTTIENCDVIYNVHDGKVLLQE